MPYDPIPALPEESDACKKAVHAALQAGHDRMCRIEKSLEENTALTKEGVEIMKAIEGGIKVFGWLGSFLKWGAGIAGAVYTIYCIVKGKSPF